MMALNRFTAIVVWPLHKGNKKWMFFFVNIISVTLISVVFLLNNRFGIFHLHSNGKLTLVFEAGCYLMSFGFEIFAVLYRKKSLALKEINSVDETLLMQSMMSTVFRLLYFSSILLWPYIEAKMFLNCIADAMWFLGYVAPLVYLFTKK
uniref:Serpentine receptor class gamma n=1 Tax=Panagrellus redivivus TaxID=6233 RepID=A0A7E4VN34_PANRE